MVYIFISLAHKNLWGSIKEDDDGLVMRWGWWRWHENFHEVNKQSEREGGISCQRSCCHLSFFICFSRLHSVILLVYMMTWKWYSFSSSSLVSDEDEMRFNSKKIVASNCLFENVWKRKRRRRLRGKKMLRRGNNEWIFGSSQLFTLHLFFICLQTRPEQKYVCTMSLFNQKNLRNRRNKSILCV